MVVSTNLKNISQIGSFPQIGMKIKTISNHHPDNPPHLLATSTSSLLKKSPTRMPEMVNSETSVRTSLLWVGLKWVIFLGKKTKKLRIPSRSLTAHLPLKKGGWKTSLSYWEGNFSGAMLNFGGVFPKIKKNEDP